VNRYIPFFAWLTVLLLMLSGLLSGFLVFQQSLLAKNIDEAKAKLQKQPEIPSNIVGMVNDLIVYSQKQPAIIPLLQKHGIPVPQPQNPPQPAK
jgi:hypothetical protein